MISQHWFRWWLGAVRQQANTWANIDPDLCRHMASLGLNELASVSSNMARNSRTSNHIITKRHEAVCNGMKGVAVHCDLCDDHDDVIKWKHFPRYWTFARRIHRSPLNSPHKGQWRGALMFSMKTSSNGNIFRVTGPLCGEPTGRRWIPRTKASDAEL